MAHPIESPASRMDRPLAYAFDDSLVVDGGAGRDLMLINSSGRFIWERLAAGCTLDETARAITKAYGLSPPDARQIVASACNSWQASETTGPRIRTRTPRGSPTKARPVREDGDAAVTRTYRFGPHSVSVIFDPPSLEWMLAGRLACIADTDAAPTHRLRLVRRGRRYVLSEGIAVLASSTRAETIFGELTRRLLELATGHGDWLAVLHAAALRAPGGMTVAFPAVGGMGKSTLALALTKAGHSYFSDDCVPINSKGEVVPAPYAICLKAGNPAIPDLTGLSAAGVSRQGGRCHYVMPDRVCSAPAPLDLIVFPERCRPAGCQPPSPGVWALGPVDSLRLLFAQRIWVNRDPGRLAGFLTMIERTPAFRLVYRSTDEAIARLAEITGVTRRGSA